MSSYPYSTNRTAGIMNAEELADLRQVFIEACHRSRLAPDATFLPGAFMPSVALPLKGFFLTLCGELR